MAHRWFTVYPDYETLAHAGAEGMFQIIELMEGEGRDEQDLTHLVDQGVMFSDAKHVEQYLTQELFPGDECDVTLGG